MASACVLSTPVVGSASNRVLSNDIQAVALFRISIDGTESIRFERSGHVIAAKRGSFGSGVFHGLVSADDFDAIIRSYETAAEQPIVPVAASTDGKVVQAFIIRAKHIDVVDDGDSQALKSFLQQLIGRAVNTAYVPDPANVYVGVYTGQTERRAFRTTIGFGQDGEFEAITDAVDFDPCSGREIGATSRRQDTLSSEADGTLNSSGYLKAMRDRGKLIVSIAKDRVRLVASVADSTAFPILAATVGCPNDMRDRPSSASGAST